MYKKSNENLIIKSISKSYKPDEPKALSNISLSVNQGDVHAIVGENAAGKSTLMKIISGLLKADSGEIFFKGSALVLGNPKAAHKMGIAFVEQEFRIAEDLTVAENIFLGNEPGKMFLFDNKKTVIETRLLSEKYGIEINPNLHGRELSTGEKQAVEILRALSRDPDLLILDEPTSVLNEEEVENLLKTILFLRKKGKTVLFVSHKLKEVAKIADRITVLRKGTVADDLSISEFNERDVAILMTGQEPIFNKFELGTPVEKVLEIEKLTTENALVKEVSLDSRKGEILGIAGIKGNGQEILIESILGLNEVTEGSIKILKKEITGLKTSDIRKLGVGYIPSDRYVIGSSKGNSILENFIPYRIRDDFFLQKKKISDLVNWTLSRLKENEITYNSIDDSLDTLSGGNLQKLLIARETGEKLNLLLLSEPTQGLDIKAANYVYNKLEVLKKETSVVVFSSDLDEILGISDRIIVMYKGKIVFNRKNEFITKKILANYIMGLKSDFDNTEEIL